MKGVTVNDKVPDDLAALFSPDAAEEPLHTDLRPHVEPLLNIGECLRHPLLYSVPYWPQMNRLLNRQYAHRLEAVAEARAAGSWERFVFMHERPYRFNALAEVASAITDASFWRLLRQVWIDSENIWEHMVYARAVWEMPNPDRQSVMTKPERAALAAMPETFPIFRGACSRHDDPKEGLSWTTSLKVAEWFSRRYSGSRPVVIEATVRRDDVLAFFTQRNESEIVVFPEMLGHVFEHPSTHPNAKKKAT